MSTKTTGSDDVGAAAHIYTDNKIFNEKLTLPKPRGYERLFTNDEGIIPLADNEFIEPCVSIVIWDQKLGLFFKYENLDHYLSFAETPKLHHEVVFGWMKQRPKFDMDDGDIQNFESVFENIQATFWATYDVVPEFVITDSSNEEKFRRHIIISNYAFANQAEAKHFSDLLKSDMGVDAKYLDWGVNKKTQNFRTVGSTKEGRTKRVIDGNEQDVWITLCGDVPVLKEIAPAEMRKEFSVVLPGAINWELIREKVDPEIWNYNEKRSSGNRLEFKRRKASHCAICDRNHDSSDMYICVFDSSIKQYCYRDGGALKKSIVLWEKPKEVFVAENITNRDHKVYFSQYTDFLKNVYEDIVPIKQFICDTIAYIIDGGNSFYVTKNDDKGVMTFSIIKEFTMRDEISIREGPKIKGRKFRDLVVEMHKYIAYDKIVFIPFLRNPPIVIGKVFNMFTGFTYAFDPGLIVEEEKFNLITKHIENIWCKNNQIVIDYIYNWMAHIIQYPTVKMGKAILLKSQAQGAGKNSVCEFFGSILGSRYVCCIDDIDNLIGRFNAHLENKLFTICDEIQNYGGAYKSNDKLKSIITRREMGVESKGLNIRRADDLNNYIFLTNNDWALKIESTDRRYLALELDNAQANNREYFNALYSQINAADASLHFFHWLANRDISKWNPDDIPETDLKRELKLNSVPTAAKFLIDIANGELSEKLGVVDGNVKIFTETLYLHFRDWLVASGERTEISKEMFSKQVGKIMKAKTIRIGESRRMGFELNIENLKLVLIEHLRLPDLFN